MKIRQGFVSNSSTCSFLVIGYHVDSDVDKMKMLERIDPEDYQKILKDAQDDEDMYDMVNDQLRETLDNEDIFFCDNGECGADRGKVIIGINIGESDEHETVEYSMEDLIGYSDRLKHLFGDIIDNNDLKLINGIRMC